MKPPAASLQARALGWLAQREQSRSELRRKLLRLARSGRQDDAGDDVEAALRSEVEALLDRLQALHLLSDERFVESRVRVRAANFGARRIESELARHGLRLDAAAATQLRDSELQRALRLWQRRFGAPAANRREALQQMRFLAARGFGVEVIRRIVAAGEPGDIESAAD